MEHYTALENIVGSKADGVQLPHLQPTTSGPVITREAQLTVRSLLMFRLVLSMLCTLHIYIEALLSSMESR